MDHTGTAAVYVSEVKGHSNQLGLTQVSHLTIPFGKIFVTLFAILIPLGLGILVRKHSLLWARRLEIGGTAAGYLRSGNSTTARGVAGDRCSKRATGDRYYHDQLPR